MDDLDDRAGTVVLVIDASAMARSAAALIHGYATFDPGLRIAGVVLNNIGSQTHAAMIRDAVAGPFPSLARFRASLTS